MPTLLQNLNYVFIFHTKSPILQKLHRWLWWLTIASLSIGSLRDFCMKKHRAQTIIKTHKNDRKTLRQYSRYSQLIKCRWIIRFNIVCYNLCRISRKYLWTSLVVLVLISGLNRSCSEAGKSQASSQQLKEKAPGPDGLLLTFRRNVCLMESRWQPPSCPRCWGIVMRLQMVTLLQSYESKKPISDWASKPCSIAFRVFQLTEQPKFSTTVKTKS